MIANSSSAAALAGFRMSALSTHFTTSATLPRLASFSATCESERLKFKLWENNLLQIYFLEICMHLVKVVKLLTTINIYIYIYMNLYHTFIPCISYTPISSIIAYYRNSLKSSYRQVLLPKMIAWALARKKWSVKSRLALESCFRIKSTLERQLHMLYQLFAFDFDDLQHLEFKKVTISFLLPTLMTFTRKE